MDTPPLVLVSGASGFIGIHCVKAVLDSGYRVRGTVRSTKNELKTKPILDLDRNAVQNGRLELVEADLMKPEGWEKAVEGCDFVFHVASPVTLETPKNRDDIIVPAVTGTINVLKACAKTTSVKRVVYTSSTVAITTYRDDINDKIFTEDDWLDPSYPNTGAYNESKMRAETSAWQFVDGLKERGEHQFELVTICPGLVLGPLLHDISGASVDLVRQMMLREIPMVPKLYMGTVDVRDVAMAHIRAIERPEAAGKRFICVSEHDWIDKIIAKPVANEFRPQGYCVTKLRSPDFMIRLASLFDSQAKDAVPYIGKRTQFDNSRIKQVLGMTNMIGSKDAAIATGYSLIERGIVPKSKKYKGQEETTRF